MANREQKKAPTRQVRIRKETAKRVDKVLVHEAADRDERLSSVDYYDELLMESLVKREKKLGL